MSASRAACVIALVILLAGCVAPEGPGAATSAPIVLAALGDSLMAGYNADAEHDGVHPEVSWPTGEGNWSFAARLGASSAENLARPAEKLAALPRQAATMTQGAFALVGFGSNDLCTGGGTDETTTVPVSAEEFAADLRARVKELLANGSQVLVVSIPDLVAMHAVAPTPPIESSFVYLYFGANCGRTADQFRAEIEAYNAAIVRVATEEGVIHDAGAIWRIDWTREMVSEIDGVHPSVEGAMAMAEAVWDAYAAQMERAPAS